MISGGWQISATLAFVSNGAAVMGGLSRQSNLLNASLARQQGQISRTQLQMLQYQQRLKGIRVAQTAAMTAIATVGFGVGVSVISHAVSDAANLERAMTGVQIATHASADAYERLRAQVISVSGITAQSAPTIAAEMQAAASVAFKDPKQLMSLFPMMAKYADVRYIASKGAEDPTHSVQQMSTFAHYFAAYGPEKMQTMLDMAAKLQFTTHASLDQLVTQGKYFIPAMVRQGVGTDTIAQYLAIMGQTGFLQGYGGSSLNAIMRYALGAESMTGHRQKVRQTAMADLGLFGPGHKFKFVDAQGNFELDPLVKFLQQRGEEMRRADPHGGGGKWFTDLGNAFGVTGQRLLQVLADKMTRQQINRNTSAMGKIPGVEGQWELYTKDLFYQLNTFRTNLQNFATVVALPLLPSLTKFFTALNNGLAPMVGYIGAHPGVGATIGIIATGLTAILGGLAVFGSLSIFAQAAGFGSVIARIGGALGWFGGLFTGGGFLDTAFAVLWRIGARFIPFVGLVIAAYEALHLLANLPDIAGRVSAWLKANQENIGYAIGYSMGTIGKAWSAAIAVMGALVGASIQAAFGAATDIKNLAALATPGGTIEYGNAIAAAIAIAQSKVQHTKGTFPSGIQRGLDGAYGGHAPFQWNGRETQPQWMRDFLGSKMTSGQAFAASRAVNVDKIEINYMTSKPIDANSGKEHGEALRRQLVNGTGFNGSGASPVSPLFPAILSTSYQH